MKSDTERKMFHKEKLHKRKNRLHVHLSKDLRSKLKAKKRSILVHKGDTVKVMRGPGKGKEGKVSVVNVVRRIVFIESVTAKTAKGKEVPLAVQPSNLLLTSLESTPERSKMFSEEAFKKKEVKKTEAKQEPKAEPVTDAEMSHSATEPKPAQVVETPKSASNSKVK
jgi:ribosomal protein uL24